MSGNPSTSPTVTPMPATAAFGVLLAVARSIARVSEIKSTLANAIRANTYSLVLHLRYVRREPHRRKREKQDAGERGYSFVFSALDVEPLFFFAQHGNCKNVLQICPIHNSLPLRTTLPRHDFQLH